MLDTPTFQFYIFICCRVVLSTAMEGSENSGDATALGETFFTTKDGTSYVLEGKNVILYQCVQVMLLLWQRLPFAK